MFNILRREQGGNFHKASFHIGKGIVSMRHLRLSPKKENLQEEGIWHHWWKTYRYVMALVTLISHLSLPLPILQNDDDGPPCLSVNFNAFYDLNWSQFKSLCFYNCKIMAEGVIQEIEPYFRSPPLPHCRNLYNDLYKLYGRLSFIIATIKDLVLVLKLLQIIKYVQD